MRLTSDITATGLRALYWHVMYPKRMLLSLAISVSGVVMLMCLAGVDGPEFLGFLRYIGRLCLGVFLTLSIGLLWKHFASRKEWAAWMRAVGTCTYDLEDRCLTVTDAAGRREFPTKEIKALEETSQRFFILMRKGPHYIIPRRVLTAEDEEEVKSFREAVAFASLHVDMLQQS
jgi:hypothetical protein